MELATHRKDFFLANNLQSVYLIGGIGISCLRNERKKEVSLAF